MDFFKWFEEILPKLEKRSVSIKKIIDYLETLPNPIFILETGCVRKINSFSRDGQSTIIFDKYSQYRGGGSKVFSVDINKSNVELCRQLISNNVYLEANDSVKFISNFSNMINEQKLSLLYLDSFDVDWKYSFESSAHHLKELTAAIPFIDDKTLVVVDDAPLNMLGYRDEKNNIKVIKDPSIGGKGHLVHEYAMAVDAEMFFSHYQVGYKNLIKKN